jgi:integrase
LYVTAIASGMREGELLGLRLEDVDLETGVIQVKRTAQTLWKKGAVISNPIFLGMLLNTHPLFIVPDQDHPK